MRSLCVVLATAAALFGAFFLYMRLAAPPARLPPAQSLPAPVADTSSEPFAAGAWVNLYDKDGLMYGRLRARLCTPEPANRCILAGPEADFYQHDGRIIHLTAAAGDVRLAGATGRSPLTGGTPALPDQGILHDVTVQMFPSAAARDAALPDLTLHMDNTQFDADTDRLFSIAQTDPVTARTIPPDRIPVTVRGRQLDFDGWGLMLIWDGQIHELKSLLIAHGNRLTLKTPNASAATASPSTDANAHSAATPWAKRMPGHVYLAEFSDNIRVVQSGQPRITANEMTVIFSEAGPAGASTSAPAPALSGKSKSAAPSSATTQPTDLYWTGPLRIIPDPNPRDALKSADAVVAFTGAPVHLHEDNLDLLCLSVHYDTATGSARVQGSPASPLELAMTQNGKPSGTLHALQADYAPDRQQVDFTGPGQGAFADPHKPADLLHLAWSAACHIALTGIGNQMQIRQAHLQGSADLRDGPSTGIDRLHLTAQDITADFLPGKNKTGPQITTLLATGQAHCLIHDEKESDRALWTDQLTLKTAADAAGKLYPQTILADGRVHVRQDDSELWSQHLRAAIAPQSQNAHETFALRTLTAAGNVRAKGKNGSTAAGDLLRVDESAGDPMTTLLGSPYASVSGDNGTLRGPEIDFDPRQNHASVVGPGLIDTLRPPSPNKPAQPMHVQWETSATLDGNKNRIDVLGAVLATVIEPSGARNTAKADRALLDLAPAPTTRPTKSTDLDLLQGKQIKTVSFLNHAEIESVLTAPGGSIIRRSNIGADRIDADLPNQRLTVPGPGRMLLEDHGKPTAAPAGESSKLSTGRGQTAIRWTGRFIFDQQSGRATIDGPVLIRHWPDAIKAATTEVHADQVIADFQQSTAAAPHQDPTLKYVTASGHVQITTFTDRTLAKPKQIIESDRVTYDPATQILTAIGGPDGWVQITDASSRHTEMVQQVQINLATNAFIVTDLSGQVR